MVNRLYDQIFGRNAGRDAPFLILPDGRRISHGAFLARAARFAGAIAGLGVRPGDRVAVQIDKSPDALAVYAGCALSGVVFLPLNTAYTPAELGYFVENAGAALFLCTPGKTEALAPVAARAGARLATLGTDGDGTLAEAADAAPDDFPPVPCGEDDLAALLYTSGTTGRSKGAMMSHRNLVSNARALADLWRFTDRDVLLHALPIYHTHGLFVATNIVALTGGAMIFLPKLDIDALIGWMPQATSLMGVPTFYTRLLEDPRFDRALAAHMRLFVSGSAPLLAETHRQFEARTGHRI
ncbi:MAG: AMP-binding protein, partial [Mangrovicoccus sp.]|nr:AMP-binding protein [Mangrovicoccus sp.]